MEVGTLINGRFAIEAHAGRGGMGAGIVRYVDHRDAPLGRRFLAME